MWGSSASGSRRNSGRRSKRRFSATRISTRARCIPRQTWGPCPNDMCGLALARAMSKRSGSSISSLLAVGRCEHQHDGRPRRHRHTVDFGVPRREPCDVEQRCFEAQCLLNCLGDQRPVRTDRLQLLRLCQQQVEEVSGGPECRLDPSGKQQPQEGEDLVVAQPFAVELGVGEPADQVLTRRPPTVRQDARQVLLDLAGCGDGFVLLGKEAQDGDRPPLELLVVLSGQSQNPRDDLGRIGEREFRTSSACPRSAKRSISSLATFATSWFSDSVSTFCRKADDTRARYRRCRSPSMPKMMCSPITGPMIMSMM